MAVVTGLVFGVGPALQSGAGELHDALKDSTRGSTAGRRRTAMSQTSSHLLRDSGVVAGVRVVGVLCGRSLTFLRPFGSWRMPYLTLGL